MFGRGSPWTHGRLLSTAPGCWSQQGLVRTQGAGSRGKPALHPQDSLPGCPAVPEFCGLPSPCALGEVSGAQRMLEMKPHLRSQLLPFVFAWGSVPEGSGKASLRKFRPRG